MEQRTVSEIVEQFEPLLRVFEKDPKLTIVHAEEEAGTKCGDNYLSIVVRSKIVGRRGDGSPYNKTFVSKRYPFHRKIAEYIRNADFFHNEAYAYKELLPLLGPVGPACIYAGPEAIIMEDLKLAGYEVCDRMDLLDMNHCVSVLQTLASFHAKSYALKLKDRPGFLKLVSHLKEAVFPRDEKPAIGQAVEASLHHAILQLESIKPRTKDVEKAIEAVGGLRGKTVDIMKDALFSPEGQFHVLVHGDPWNNNLLFKHDQAGRVVDVKLVDFQVMRHVSIATDFHYFVNSSAKSSIIDDHYEDLVETYYRSFVGHLRKLNLPEENIRDLTLDLFKAELKKYADFGILSGFLLVNAVLAEDEDVIDLDSLSAQELQELSARPIPARPRKAERVMCVTSHYLRTYC
ncbi:uncharacterized protein LOC105698151 [Orussus abietinus]|uniref:uncharacterized protein LOC105698151 n=1 Tax=Orussus abietinus TaxID=222816 RepID=UPI000626A37D|nr:uncharacterized protein LOC105698151 [Orussus abietinus]